MAERFAFERFDRSELVNGALRIDATLTRSGVFEYAQPGGGVIREWRPPAEVLKADSIATLRDVPVTVLHQGMVGPHNYKQLKVGHATNPISVPDQNKVDGQLIIGDGETISKAQRKDLKEVSCGYQCNVVPGGGVTPSGEHYDATQTDIKYNHVAIGPAGWGRQGATVAMRLDSKGDQVFEALESARESNKMKITIKVDGRDHEVEAGSAEHLQLQARKDAQVEQVLANTNAERDREKARADAADKVKGEMQTKLDAAPAQARAAIEKRIKIETNAKKLLGADFKCDGKSDKEIQTAAILKRDPSFVVDGKSDAYLEGMFDTYTREDAGVSSQMQIAAALGGGGAGRTDAATNPGAPIDLAKKRQDMKDRNQKAWEQPLTVSQK